MVPGATQGEGAVDMGKIRVGINGFGRVGRSVFKQMIADESFEVVGINDPSDLGDLAYLLKYDSVYGWYSPKVDDAPERLIVDGREIPFYSKEDPGEIPWQALEATIVIEASGAFRARGKAALHLEAGAQRVIISAPSDDADGMFVLGVNEKDFNPDVHRVVSMASCTTNCLAPVPDGSIIDIVATLERGASASTVNQALREASSRPPLEGILRVSDEALVSRDILGDPHSAIVDAESSMVVGDRMVKVLAWYDNEWAYSARLKDFAKLIADEAESWIGRS